MTGRVLVVAGLVGMFAVVLTVLMRVAEARAGVLPVWCLPVLLISAVAFSVGVVWSRDR